MRVHWINLERNSPNYYQLVVWRVNIAKYRLVSSFDSNLCSYYQNYKRFVSSDCIVYLKYQQGKRPKDAGGTGTKAGLELGPDGRAFAVG